MSSTKDNDGESVKEGLERLGKDARDLEEHRRELAERLEESIRETREWTQTVMSFMDTRQRRESRDGESSTAKKPSLALSNSGDDADDSEGSSSLGSNHSDMSVCSSSPTMSPSPATCKRAHAQFQAVSVRLEEMSEMVLPEWKRALGDRLETQKLQLNSLSERWIQAEREAQELERKTEYYLAEYDPQKLVANFLAKKRFLAFLALTGSLSSFLTWWIYIKSARRYRKLFLLLSLCLSGCSITLGVIATMLHFF